MAKAGKLAQIKKSGASAAFTDEATVTTDDQTYRISNQALTPFDRTGTITVKDSAVPTVESFTVNRLTGEITFDTVDNTRVITVSGNFIATATIGEAFDFSYTIDASNEDITVFGDEFMARIQALKDISGSISRFDVTTQDLFDEIDSGNVVVIEFFHDNTLAATEWDIRVWGILSSVEDSSAVDSVMEESIDFEGSTDNDNRAFSTNP